MLRDVNEVQVGRIVHLYPQTKTASANVHRMLAVSVLKDPAAHWPMVVVGWKEDGTDFWELVHRDNIRTRSPAARTRSDDKEGDNIREGGGVSSKWAKVKKLPGKAAPTIEGQDTLF